MDLIKTSEEDVFYPNLDLAQLLHKYDLSLKTGSPSESLQTEIIQILEKDAMAPLFQSLVGKYSWDVSEDKISELRFVNEQTFIPMPIIF